MFFLLHYGVYIIMHITVEVYSNFLGVINSLATIRANFLSKLHIYWCWHVIKAENSFTLEGDEQLVRVAKLSTLKEWQKCVALVKDEMFIREDLLYDKNNEELIGFTVTWVMSITIWLHTRSLLMKTPFPSLQTPCLYLWSAVYSHQWNTICAVSLC